MNRRNTKIAPSDCPRSLLWASALFVSQSQGQAASTRADVPIQLTAAEAQEDASDVSVAGIAVDDEIVAANSCTPEYCEQNPVVCELMGCRGY